MKTNDDLIPVELGKVKPNSFVHLDDSSLWIKGFYQRKTRRCCLLSFDDCNKQILRKPSLTVFVESIEDLKKR